MKTLATVLTLGAALGLVACNDAETVDDTTATDTTMTQPVDTTTTTTEPMVDPTVTEGPAVDGTVDTTDGSRVSVDGRDVDATVSDDGVQADIDLDN